MLTQQVEVGCVGVVQILWCTCVISERAQPPLVSTLDILRIVFNMQIVHIQVHTCIYLPPPLSIPSHLVPPLGQKAEISKPGGGVLRRHMNT